MKHRFGNLTIATIAVVTLGIISGCTPLTAGQKAEYELLKDDGMLVMEKDPTSGAVLGILPGFGSFYAREPVVGVIDLLLWPASVLWDPAVGYTMSKKVNYDITIAKMDRDKRDALDELTYRYDVEELSAAEFKAERRQIMTKYAHQ